MHSELEELEGDLGGFIHDRGGGGCDEGRGCAGEDVAILVLKEEVREVEDAHDVLGDGDGVLLHELVQLWHCQS